MKSYFFITLRYQPERAKQEFVNIGVALYASGQFLGAKFNPEMDRLRALFNGVSRKRMRAAIGHLNLAFNELEKVPTDRCLQSIADDAVPHEHNELQWSKVRSGMCDDFREELDLIYSRQITNRITTPTDARRNDAAVWKHFREPLRRLGVDSRLTAKPIETLAGGHTFHHAFQNRKKSEWSLYQPVSLDLADPRQILDRAYHWLGRGIALSEASEPHHITFLVGTTENPDERCSRAIEQAIEILRKIGPNRVSIVRESESEAFAEQLANELVLAA